MPQRIALLTGFEAWAGQVNPSGIVAGDLDGIEIDGVKVVGRELAEDFYKLPRIVSKLLREFRPSVVVSTGWDYVSRIKVEKIAVNTMDSVFGNAVVPDNYGNRPSGEPVISKAPLAVRATFPAELIVQNLNKAGVPAMLSYHAGTHCCNTVMFSVLHSLRLSRSRAIAGFMHFPPSPEMNVERPGIEPMSIEGDVEAVKIALRTCRDYLGRSRRSR